MVSRRRLRRTLVLAALSLSAGLVVGSCGRGDTPEEAATGSGAVQMSGVVRETPLNMGGITLPDASAGGAPFTLKAQPDGVLLVFFGYTNCPDVCPTTMSEVKRVRRNLGEDGSRVGVAMVTVDPARDTGQVLSTYLGHFFDDAHALRTDDPAVLDGVMANVGITVTTRPTSDPAFYTVDHTATLFAVAADGNVVVEWPFGTSAQAIESDLRKILDQEEP